LKFTLASTSPGLRRTLSKTTSIDKEYLQKVISASKKDQTEEEKKDEARAAQDAVMADEGAAAATNTRGADCAEN
jgi:hypothetical protein